MRIDHHAYQRATRVAGFGLLVQAVLALALFLFGRLAGDTAFTLASIYVGIGVLAFLGLVVIFHQHKLERLEALEEDELAGAAATSVFDRSDEEIRVAARRLRLMHTWLMPILSVLIALGLALSAWAILAWIVGLKDPESDQFFSRTDHLGWAIAICLSFATLSFIISRFIAGMAKQQVWQNLRGGAGYMVGNAVVLLAVAVGVVFRFFDNDAVIEYIAVAIAIFMIVFAAEILLNLLLNFYRPRVPGDVPRPAFDSKVLSLLAAPDNLVRSINEAINYQFGFDVTSTWGYQLLLRSFVALLVIGVVVLIGLNTMVVVEPHEQAVRLRFGQLIGADGAQVHRPGLMWKLPWPVETAEVHDVTRVRTVSLTARRTSEREYWNWEDSLEGKTDSPLDPFVVRSSREANDVVLASNAGEINEDAALDVSMTAAEIAAQDRLRRQLALANIELAMDYRIRAANDGLLDYLRFGDETIERRQRLTNRQRALRDAALSEVTAALAGRPLDEVLDQDNGTLATDLRDRVQGRFDQLSAGVDVMAIHLLMVRPAAARHFIDLPVAEQTRLEEINKANRNGRALLVEAIGDLSRLDPILEALDSYEALGAELAALPDDAPTSRRETLRAEVDAQRQVVHDLLTEGSGAASALIEAAESTRWVEYMNKRARAERTSSQLRVYAAAPRLFRQRILMDTYRRQLEYKRKFILGFDPESLDLEIIMKQLNPVFNFQDTQENLEEDFN